MSTREVFLGAVGLFVYAMVGLLLIGLFAALVKVALWGLS